MERDHHYTYNVTINGVDDIVVEVEDENEKTPGAEGVVFKHEAFAHIDAHFDQVEMKFMRKDIEKGVYLYTDTPFGVMGVMYYPKGTPDGGSEGKCVFREQFRYYQRGGTRLSGVAGVCERDEKGITISIMEQNRIRKAPISWNTIILTR